MSSVRNEEPAPAPEEHKPFSMLRFGILVVAQYGLLLAAVRFLAPALWARQFAAGWPALIGVFLGMHLLLCFFEWGFHRYVLHSITAPGLAWFANAHRNHHGLTPIRLQSAGAGSGRYVLNRYPIVDDDQHHDSAFPVYALAGFWLFFTPLLIGLQLLLPRLPIVIGGYSGITLSMSLYEILHAIEHKPYEWWKGATEHPRTGPVWRKLYGFHHMHHANVSCNEAISGFFGLPLADWAFGTYHQPRELLLEGRMATAKDFAVPPPPPFVRWLDSWARRRESSIRRED